MMEMIDNVARGASSKAARRGRAVALVAAASLVLALVGLAQAPAASAITGNISSSLPVTTPATPWNIPFLAKVVATQLTVPGVAADFTVVPALPQGLSLSTTGVFTGIPSVLSGPQTYTITASVVGDPVVVTMPITLAVVPNIIAPVGTINGTAGQPLPAGNVLKAEGFTVPLLTFNPPLPWLSIDLKGVMSGTPPTAGAVTSVVTASESGFPGGQTATATLNFNIAPAGATPPPAGAGLTPATQTAVGTVGVALAPALAAFPSSATTKYTVTPDITLAAGLTFSTTSGLVSGSPTKSVAAGTAFLIEQRDVTSNAVLASSSLNLTVNGSLGATQVVRVVAGANLTSTVPFGPTAATAAGLGAGVTFSVSPALPTGLVLDPATGALSGVPAAAVAGDFVITATDAAGAKATGTVTISVGGSIAPAFQSLTGTVGQNVTSQAMSATGMRAPIIYSIAPVAPGGLQFDPATGVLSGIPTVAVLNGSFTITATDAAAAKSTASLTLTVSQGLLATPVIGTVTGGAQIGSLQIYFATPTGATAGQSYTVQVYDATGTTLVTSVTTTTSPVTVTGLVGGTTYSVIVMTGGLDGTAPVQSLPKTGTASSTATAQSASFASGGTVPFSLNSGSTSSLSSLSAFGITVGTAAKTKKATKAFATKKPTRKIKKAEKIHAPVNTFVSIVFPKIPVKGLVQVMVRVQKHNWVSAGYVQADDSGQLTLPALESSNPGTFAIKLKPPAGKSGHVKIVFDAPKGSSSDSSSSDSSSSSSSSGSSTKKPSSAGTQSGF